MFRDRLRRFFESRSLILLCFAMLFALPALLCPFLWHRQSGLISLDPGAPLFSEPRVGAPLKSVVEKGVDLPYSRHVARPLKELNFGRENYQLQEYYDFYKISDGEETFWACPDLTLEKPADGAPAEMRKNLQSRWRLLPLALFAFGGLILCGALARSDSRDSGRVRVSTAVFAIAFGAQFLFSVYLLACGNIHSHVFDGVSYFKIAQDFLNCAFPPQERWRYTIGYPLTLLPSLWLSASPSVEDFYEFAGLFNSMLVWPALLGMVALLVKKLSGSTSKAFLTGVALAILPFVYYPFEMWGPPSCFRAFFMPPGFDISSFRPMYVFLWTGYDVMSDEISSFLVVASLLCSLYLKPGLRSLAFISALFGFACLVRINNVFFVPLLAYALFHSNRTELGSPAFLVKAFATSIFVALAVFLPQLYFNFREFGSPFIFPYSLHVAANNGFDLWMFWRGIQYLPQTNLLYFSLGIAGLFFIEDKFARNILVFWCAPLVIFFCGYSCVSASAIRFILPVYGALLGAFACASVWSSCPLKERVLAFSLIASNLLFVAPPFGYLALDFKLQPLMISSFGVRLFLAIAVPVASVLIAFCFLRGNKRLLLFTLLFLSLFLLASGELLIALLCCLLLWSSLDFLRSAVLLCLVPSAKILLRKTAKS